MNDNAKKWVEALRSGEYRQTKNRLTRLNSEGKVVSNCCLGVACEVAIENGVTLKVENIDVLRHYEGRSTSLPDAVISWLGLHDCDGHFREDGWSKCLTDKNDNGHTFAEIADIIESEPKGLFVAQ